MSGKQGMSVHLIFKMCVWITVIFSRENVACDFKESILSNYVEANNKQLFNLTLAMKVAKSHRKASTGICEQGTADSCHLPHPAHPDQILL